MKGIKTGLALMLALGGSPFAYANITFTVTTFSDEVDANLSDGLCLTASSTCSLRAAIQEANLRDAATTTTIEIPNSGIYYLGGQLGDGEDDALTGDLDVKRRVVINGAGSDLVAIDGQLADRIFDVKPAANLTVNDVTIRNGHNIVPVVNQDLIAVTEISQLDGGGGIKVVEGALVLNRVNLTGNAAGGLGGGIDSRSSNVTINASLISDNRVAGFGGGISNMNGRLLINDSSITRNRNSSSPDLIFGGGIFNSGDVNSLEINRTTIAENSAFRDGGGIYHQIGGLLITNSTISGNEAGRWGGGLFNANTTPLYAVQLQHVTIADNDAWGNVREISQIFEPTDPKGGGLYNRSQAGGGGFIQLYNSLVVLNGEGGDCFNDLNSPPAFLEKMGTVVGDATCLNAGEAAPTVILDAGTIGMWPLLGDNGGATQTHALLAGSIAIDAADGEFCPNHDQRKYGPRGISSCDSGAFEYGATDFGEPLVTPALPYSGGTTPPPPSTPPTTPTNALPQAFDLLIVVPYEGAVDAEVTAIDPDNDLEYLTFVQKQPAKGVVSWSASNDGTFTYAANAGESGVDSFGFSACEVAGDGICSQATVNVVINEPSVESRVIATLEPNNTSAVSPVTVISESDLLATMSDPDFAYPLGAMFFDVTDVVPDAGVDTITVTLHLPATMVIAPDAVVRKMNQFGIWSTLSTVPSSTESSAVFDAAARTVTLVLRDNDIFDLNSANGVISDPVALGVSTTTAPVATSGSEATSSPAPTADESGGGGISGPGWLVSLLFLALWRRRVVSRNPH